MKSAGFINNQTTQNIASLALNSDRQQLKSLSQEERKVVDLALSVIANKSDQGIGLSNKNAESVQKMVTTITSKLQAKELPVASLGAKVAKFFTNLAQSLAGTKISSQDLGQKVSNVKSQLNLESAVRGVQMFGVKGGIPPTKENFQSLFGDGAIRNGRPTVHVSTLSQLNTGQILQNQNHMEVPHLKVLNPQQKNSLVQAYMQNPRAFSPQFCNKLSDANVIIFVRNNPPPQGYQQYTGPPPQQFYGHQQYRPQPSYAQHPPPPPPQGTYYQHGASYNRPPPQQTYGPPPPPPKPAQTQGVQQQAAESPKISESDFKGFMGKDIKLTQTQVKQLDEEIGKATGDAKVFLENLKGFHNKVQEAASKDRAMFTGVPDDIQSHPDNWKDLTQGWQRQLLKMHPDKADSLSLSPEMKKIATELTSELTFIKNNLK